MSSALKYFWVLYSSFFFPCCFNFNIDGKKELNDFEGRGGEKKNTNLLGKQPSDCEVAPAYQTGLFCPLSHNYGKAGSSFCKGKIRVGRRRGWEVLVCPCDTLLTGTMPGHFFIPL